MLSRTITAAVGLAVVLASCGSAPAQDSKDKAAPSPAAPSEPKKSEAPKAKAKAKGKAAPEKADPNAKTETATFGGGCFWCLEAVFERVPGVKNVVSGFSGGFTKKPSYEAVSTGETGHAEVVQITFDPEKVSYERLAEIFFACHDPTTLNRQGPDFGTQYRSIILYHTEDQKATALKVYKTLTDGGAFAAPIVTELVPYKIFYPADRHHQDFYRKNRADTYCQMIITPKLQKLMMHGDIPASDK